MQIVIVVLAGKLFFGIGWPKDWLELAVFAAAGVVRLAALGIAWSHVIPNFDAAPAYANIVFLPVIFISGVFYDVDNAPQFLRDIAQALPLIHSSTGSRGRWSPASRLADNLGDLRGHRRVGRASALLRGARLQLAVEARLATAPARGSARRKTASPSGRGAGALRDARGRPRRGACCEMHACDASGSTRAHGVGERAARTT